MQSSNDVKKLTENLKELKDQLQAEKSVRLALEKKLENLQKERDEARESRKLKEKEVEEG